ncbi:fimbrial chaperone protein [Escherichia coli]|uniref:Fimbrial chaperone protein n=1 Tax=Escherichia coli TaxID=562 RepID=A0A447Y2I8_ECOLX|nr:fimbrial chaperone protein [Escherichia coli]
MLPVVWHLVCLLWLILLFPVHASFIKSDQKSVSVRLENKGNSHLLVQSWLDTGDDNAEPGSINVPFTATPPVSRIDAKRGQTIKLMYTGSTVLPSDKESVFWFNVLEVPPKPDASKVENQSLLQLAFRTRIQAVLSSGRIKR